MADGSGPCTTPLSRADIPADVISGPELSALEISQHERRGPVRGRRGPGVAVLGG